MKKVEETISKLQEIIPEAFVDSKLDILKLKKLLGESEVVNDEKFVLNWTGKNEAYKQIHKHSKMTLVPSINQSVAWNKAQHVFIEGENMETLKILQKAYHEKIKMIYIDPPYNTGSERFVYSDNFSKQKNGKILLKNTSNSNESESGCTHSNWLSMMLPRLTLARNLLKPDGVIFISIGDREQANLKILCDEIFGEDNFVAQFIWRKKAGGANDSEDIAVEHEYIICYRKSQNGIYKLPLHGKTLKNYRYEDEKVATHGKYSLKDLNDKSLSDSSGLHYDIECPDGTILKSDENQWKCNLETYLKRLNDNRIVFKKSRFGEWKCYYKIYLNEQKGELILDADNNPIRKQRNASSLLYDIALNKQGNDDIKKLFDFKPFDYPKPVKLMQHLIQISTIPNNNDIILDFFAGSGTIGQAVLEQNAMDKGNRQFICVQLDEKITNADILKNTDYKFISEISFDRIKKSLNSLEQNNKNRVGVRYFKLSESRLKDSDYEEFEYKMLWELMLKNGNLLTSNVEKISSDDFSFYIEREKNQLFYIGNFSDKLVAIIKEIKPKIFVTPDSMFGGNEDLKTDFHVQLANQSIEFHSY